MNTLPHITDCGLPELKAIPYGIHMCHFFLRRQDLAAALVPYFVAGLYSNERCIWITAEPLGVEAAEAELAKAGLDTRALARKGSLLIRDHSDWYDKSSELNAAKTMEMWLDEERRSLEVGYSGLRITSNTSFVKPADWSAFMEYEDLVGQEFASRRIVTLCSYVLDRRAAADLLDVVSRHSCTLHGPDDRRWQLAPRSDLDLSNQRLNARV